MKRLSILLTVLAITAIAFAPAAHAQYHKGDGDLTLGGSGVSDKNLDDTVFSGSLDIGTLVTNNFELGVRQGVTYDNSFSGTTAAFADFNFNLGKLVPFVGGSAGIAYGQEIDHDLFAGPEAGLKIFMSERTYLYGRAAYRFDLQDGFDTGGFAYSVGIGTRW